MDKRTNLSADEALKVPNGTVVRNRLGYTSARCGDKWWGSVPQALDEPYSVVSCAEEPSHDMCARLIETEAETRPDGSLRWALKHPNGGIAQRYTNEEAVERGYPIDLSNRERAILALRKAHVADAEFVVDDLIAAGVIKEETS